ncbi:MAG: hypothetical protein JNL70_22650 [Saprospiraceae bacterium]|nr:hypothetical protein [Saprospiraceae bacterium]
MQKLKFEAEIYHKKPSDPYNSFVYGSLLVVAVGCIFLAQYNFAIVKFLLVVLLPIPILVKIYGMANTEQADLGVTTSLEITPEKIWIGTKSYLWRDIKDITLRYSDYEGLGVYRMSHNYKPNFSAGIDNFIAFEMQDGEKVSNKFKLYSPLQADDLRRVIEEVAAKGYLPLEKIQKIYESETEEELRNLKSIYNTKSSKS